MKIKDIMGKTIEVTNLRLAIKECRLGLNSPFKMDSGHTVGENYYFMLEQLDKIKKTRKRRTEISVRFYSYEICKLF